ncbi:MAG: hypothetical protein QM784_39310 [Polyangiaceae bacterium]
MTTRRFENGTFALIENKIEDGTIFYHSARAQACIDAVSRLGCEGLLERDQPECLDALDGKVELGGDCDLDEECAGSALCQSSGGTCPGKCVGLLKQGQSCGADGDCDDGLQCSKETKLCVMPAGKGESCENGSPPCGPGLLCLGKGDDGFPKTPGICRDATDALSGSEGTACDPGAGLLCKAGLSCVAQSYEAANAKVAWQCVKSGSYLTGESCKPGVPDPCSSGNYCKTGTGLLALTGTCTAIPDALQPCGTGFGAQCKAGAVCVSGICQEFADNGVSCTGDDMCYSEYCGKTGGCEPRVPCK